MRWPLACLVGVALTVGCHHAPVTVAPRVTFWILAPTADDNDRICVPPDAWTAPSETDACTTVGDVRRYVRGRRLAE